MTRLALLLWLCVAPCLASCAGSAGGKGDVKPYPLDVCIVSGNRLGSMGDPVTKVHDGQEVKFCCAPCVDEFDANPAEFLEKLPR